MPPGLGPRTRCPVCATNPTGTPYHQLLYDFSEDTAEHEGIKARVLFKQVRGRLFIDHHCQDNDQADVESGRQHACALGGSGNRTFAT